jgi:Glycosyltransferase
MPFQFLWKILRYRISVEKCIIYSPPLPLAFVGIGLRFFGVKTLLNLQDLFPQNAIDLGVLRNPLQILFFRIIESISYRFSNFISVHSEGNRNMVIDQNPSLVNKLHVLHNWIEIEHFKTKNSFDFRKEWNIYNPFIAVFAGVMGPSQYLELLLYLAEKMQDVKELLFLFVGDGNEKFNLQKMAKEKSLSNVRFEGFVSHKLYPELLRICNIGLVCLSPLNKTPVVPGKILGYMAAGLPIAAFLKLQVTDTEL